MWFCIAELRNKLIEFCRSEHSTFHLSPLLEEEDIAPLIKFNVLPDIHEITLERTFDRGSEIRERIKKFRQMFLKQVDFSVKYT